MSINATASTSVSSSSQISGSSSAESTKKSGSSSFKDEMEKVSSENSKDKASDKKSEDVSEKKNNDDNSIKDNIEVEDENKNLSLNGQVEYDKSAPISLLDANSMLTNDIRQVLNSSTLHVTSEIMAMDEIQSISSMMSLDFSSSISMSQSDAEFFVNLTQNNDVSMQNITVQAQNLLNQGADVREVQKNVKISETLLNALNTAKENNQPLRIDFDQNIAVILRVGKDGALAANFIPGDKAVEQYLRNNIESLKNTFTENDLPYSDLSYSNRGSKQQKENRRNKQ